MRVEIAARIRDILDTITPVTDTVWTVASRTPEGFQNYEGYVAIARPTQSSWQWLDAQRRSGTLQWDISIYSPEVRLGLVTEHEERMLAYADKVDDLFVRRTRLELNGVALNNVTRAWLTGDRLTAPAPYPEGQQTIMRYRYSFTLTVEAIVIYPC